MRKVVKTFWVILIFFVVVPTLAGVAVTALWNSVLVSACGFAAIGFTQGVELFLLGQILTGGFVMGMFFLVGSMHHIHSSSHHDMGRHWHNMIDEQRREFIARRHEFFRFRNNNSRQTEDAAE